jgi:hypothetical protein
LGRARRLEVLWAEPEDLLETEVAVAEGGRDTRVLGDPMDLIRCQNYLAEPTVAKQYTQQDKWHCKRSVRQDGETIVMREKKELNPFSPLKTLDYYWLLNIVF